MGKQGFRKLSELCYHKAHYAADEIAKLSGYAVHDVNPFFQEFVINCPVPARKVNETLLKCFYPILKKFLPKRDV